MLGTIEKARNFRNYWTFLPSSSSKGELDQVKDALTSKTAHKVSPQGDAIPQGRGEGKKQGTWVRQTWKMTPLLFHFITHTNTHTYTLSQNMVLPQGKNCLDNSDIVTLHCLSKKLLQHIFSNTTLLFTLVNFVSFSALFYLYSFYI